MPASPLEVKEKTMDRPNVVSREEWLVARKALLTKEKEATRRRDALAAERRALPMVRIEKPYVFDGPQGRRTLLDLFEGRPQLIVYHFMFDPSWSEGCKSCSLFADTFNGAVQHLRGRDTAFAAISRAPLEKLLAFQRRMGWSFPWYSSVESDFNYDFHVTFTPEDHAAGRTEYNYVIQKFPESEAPGSSVFLREGDEVFHTYSTYARGLDHLIGTYNLLDLTPLGRHEEGLPHTMAWVRHHDRYE
jgi:predicted dithiol-disulfide oxidoreductase (DUF899 family)